MYNAKQNGISAPPFFSIVIASLNNFENLIRCIESINSQDFKSYEVLISDGGSNDGTKSLLSDGHILNLKWWKSSPDSGIYYALNSGIKEASGDWILVLGSDDELSDSNALNRAFTAMSRYEEQYSLIYSNILIRNKSNIRLKKYPEFNDFCDKFSGAPFIHHQSAFISRKSIIKNGFFDTNYRIHADYDLMLRIIKGSSAIKIDNTFVIFNASGYSSKINNLIRSMIEVRFIRQNLGFKQLNMRIFLIYLRVLARALIGKILLVK
jgi:glycosyltransferase involved in cell wall biosynthesis